MTTSFAFLPTEFRAIAESGTRAEGHSMGGPPVSMLASPWSRLYLDWGRVGIMARPLRIDSEDGVFLRGP